MSSYQLNSKYNFAVLLFVELAVAERDSKSASVSFSFFFFSVGSSQKVSQAFLAETVETGNKNRHDLHCMQMSLVMSMRLIFEGD